MTDDNILHFNPWRDFNVAQLQPDAFDPDPDADQIAVFLETVFGYSDGWIPVRGFVDKGQGFDGRPHNIWIEAGATAREKVVTFAAWAAREGAAVYVIPGTVAASGQAKAADVRQMQTIVVDLDAGDIGTKLDHLVRHLGDPTLVVESGGRTAEGASKLHIWWRLTEPAEGEDLVRLCRLRGDIAVKVGGDTVDALSDRLVAASLMVLAMMGPLTGGPMQHLWHRSLARHRLRSIALFTLVYIALWSLTAALLALALDAANASRIDNTVLLALTLLIALAWQTAPQKAIRAAALPFAPAARGVRRARPPRPDLLRAAARRLVHRVVLGRDACRARGAGRPYADADRERADRVGAALARAAARRGTQGADRANPFFSDPPRSHRSLRP